MSTFEFMKFEYAEIPADLVDTVDEWRSNMVEAAAGIFRRVDG